MTVLRTEIWRKHPLLKKPAWDTVKETLAFMDETMGCGDNISNEDRLRWRREYQECRFSLPWTKKNIYGFAAVLGCMTTKGSPRDNGGAHEEMQ